MFCMQVGTAVSVPLLLKLGPTAATGLRLVGAAMVLLLFVRPTITSLGRPMLLVATALGIAMCGMSLFFAQAVSRIPLGTAAAIEFLGPLSLALVTSRRWIDVVLAALAVSGVVLLTGLAGASGVAVNITGIGFALLAGACWASYIVLTKKVGSQFKGADGLSLALIVAAVAISPATMLSIKGPPDLWTVGVLILLGAFIPLIPYGLEMAALQRMTARSFGIFMCVDPAIATFAGWLVLGQKLGWAEFLGLVFVTVASFGAIGCAAYQEKTCDARHG
ncbi:EamA family transporter [Agrobacterium vitis]|nr:EamA family transporter [Agrobacterium vitis]